MALSLLVSLLFLLVTALVAAFPLVVGVAIGLLAGRRRGARPAEPEEDASRPGRVLRLSIPAFISGLLWMMSLPAFLAVRWGIERLTWVGTLPGPPGKSAAGATAVCMALVGLVLGLVSVYRIGLQPTRLRGKGYAYPGVLFSWWTLLLFGLRLPNMMVGDAVERRCSENVARLAQATRLYVADYNGVFPPAERWSDVVWPYLDGDLQSTPSSCGYAFNASLSEKRLEDLSDPGRTVAVFDTEMVTGQALPHGGPELLQAAPCHSHGDNYGFADGTQRWLIRRRSDTGGRAELVWTKRPQADWVRWKP